jgi:small-conductance mechanosensitive channel
MNILEKIQNFLPSQVTTVVGALLAGGILYLVLRYFLNRWLSKTKSWLSEVDVPFELLYKPFLFLLPVLCVLFVMPAFGLPETMEALVRQGLTIAFIMGISWLSARILTFIKTVVLSRYDLASSDNLKARQINTQLSVTQQILNVLIFIVAVSTILMTFDKVRQIGVGILASAGIAGIIIGFAAQRSLATFIAGIQIAITQPIRIDDVIVIENEWGRIEEITLTYAVIKIWDERRLIVPISYFIEKPFQNWTRTTSQLLGAVFIYADYSVPVQELRNELNRILESEPQWDKRVATVQVTNSTEQTVEIRILVSAENSSNTWNLRCLVRERMIEFLQKKYPDCLPRIRLETAEHKSDAR